MKTLNRYISHPLENMTNLEAFIRMEADIEKKPDYDKVVKLSDFCRKLIADNEEGIVVDEITRYSNERGYKKVSSQF